MGNLTEKKLPFAEDDRLQYETTGGETTSVKILTISKDTNNMFVVDENEFDFEFRITDVLDRIKDGLFAVKVAS